MNTYLGQKGYTLIKSELTMEQQCYIRDNLTIKPFTPGAPVSVSKTFPAYRESDKKYYVPRYFGEEHFGPPKSIKIPDGTDVSLAFNGALRDYQRPVVDKFIAHALSHQTIGGLLELPCAFGKTSLSLYILSVLKKKTMVIVHKEFLMNQWIERINQFLPDARIGKIQGQIIDIEDKDIVLCMLQSLSMKEYPSSLFDTFGFTIIDEVHHISSETFSNALFKLVTKYMLGLSATMNRKDGTTKVFKMFLGPVVHKVERKDEHNVTVRCITFESNDDDFNEEIMDYRGKPQLSSMISKLCSYSRRTEFIIRVLTDFITVDNVDPQLIVDHRNEMNKQVPNCAKCGENRNYPVRNTCCDQVKYCLPCLNTYVEWCKNNPVSITKPDGSQSVMTCTPKCWCCNKRLKFEQNYIENPYIKPMTERQTIILSHNLNVLEYIYTKIVCKNIASVGYYVGGMKDAELKRSEKQQVILATFSMAAEALDIPSLNAEFLITPKTDIEQSVGRILRAKHAISSPVIYDMSDTHSCFVRQLEKRKTYYRKQNYAIMTTSSTKYSPQDSCYVMESCTKKMVKNENNSCKKVKNKKTKTQSSSDRSITEDSESEDELEVEVEEKVVKKVPVCFLKIKK